MELDSVEPRQGSGSRQEVPNPTIFSTSALSAGLHSITAVYGGDPNFTTSTSLAIPQLVLKPLTIGVVSSASSASAGTPATLTATVAPASPGGVMPTGTVTFYDGSTVLGTEPLDSNGQATLTVKWTSVGSLQITAKYNGDSGFDTVTSNILETVS